jgi:hypothetical protein
VEKGKISVYLMKELKSQLEHANPIMKKKLHRHYMKKEIERNSRKVELTENMKEDI